MPRTADLYLQRSDSYKQYSAYTLDPEHGWIGTHRLPIESAIKYSLDYRSRTAGGLVAVVPDDVNPNPILHAVSELGADRLVNRVMALRNESYDAVNKADRLVNSVMALRDESYDAAGKALPYGRCDECGKPCDVRGCTHDRNHISAFEQTH